jgi:hypothetical protein
VQFSKPEPVRAYAFGTLQPAGYLNAIVPRVPIEAQKELSAFVKQVDE